MLIFSKVFDRFEIAHKTCLIFVWGAVPLEMGRPCHFLPDMKAHSPFILKTHWSCWWYLILQQEMKRATENAAQTTFVAKTVFLFGFGPGIRPNSSISYIYMMLPKLWHFVQRFHPTTSSQGFDCRKETMTPPGCHPDLPNFLSFCTILLLFCIIFIMSLPHLDLCNLSLFSPLCSPHGHFTQIRSI